VQECVPAAEDTAGETADSYVYLTRRAYFKSRPAGEWLDPTIPRAGRKKGEVK
jgi:hypothetical protein